MALSRKEWKQVVALRETYEALDRKLRWSLTVGVYDEKGRRRQFAAKLAGPYPGGLAAPFFFDDLNSLKEFLAAPLNEEHTQLLKAQEKRPADVTVLNPRKNVRRRCKAA